jgi:hypothetical protein
MPDRLTLPGVATVLDQLTSFLFTAGVPRPPRADPDIRAQALEFLEQPGRLRAAWAGVMRGLENEGYEAGAFALLCRVQLNLLDNCAVLLEVLGRLSDQLSLPREKLRSAEGRRVQRRAGAGAWCAGQPGARAAGSRARRAAALLLPTMPARWPAPRKPAHSRCSERAGRPVPPGPGAISRTHTLAGWTSQGLSLTAAPPESDRAAGPLRLAVQQDTDAIRIREKKLWR